MPFTLYNAPQSTCSQRVRFVLNAKGLPFEEQKLDLLAGDQLKPDYLKGRLEKFFSPSLRESDSVTARENGQMERASHGTEGLFRC